MPINTEELINLIACICDQNGLRVAFVQSFKGALLAGAVTGIGGLLLGPIGLAVGGALGGGIASLRNYRKFEAVSTVLSNMSHEQKVKLCRKVENAFKDFNITDVIALSSLILSDTSMAELAVEVVKKYLTTEFSYTVTHAAQ